MGKREEVCRGTERREGSQVLPDPSGMKSTKGLSRRVTRSELYSKNL